MEILILNIALYLIIFWGAFKKHKGRCSDVVLAPFLWLCCAVFSILSYQSSLCYTGYSHKLTIIPFVWLAIMFIVYYWYFIDYNSTKILSKVPVSNCVRFLASIFAFSAILPFIENVIVIIFNGLNWSFVLSAKDSGFGISATSHMSWISAKLMSINYCGFFVLPSFFFQLIADEKKNKLLLVGLVIAILNILMVNMLNGSRNIITQYVLFIFYNYLFHRQFFGKIVSQKVKLIAIVLGSLILVYILFITLNRFTDVERASMGSPADWFFLYMGEEFQNFNCDGWWIGFRTEGLSSFDSLLSVLGYKTKLIVYPYREYMFYTAFNDLYADFGALFSIVYSIIFVFLLRKYSSFLLKIKNYNAYMIVNNLIAFYLICGMWYNPYVNLWIQFFAAVIILIIIRFSHSILSK